MEGSQGGDSYGDLASWRKLQTCLTGLLGKIEPLKIASHPSAAGPSAAVGDQDTPSWNNKEEKSQFCIWSPNWHISVNPQRKIYISIPSFKAMSFIFSFWNKKLFNTNLKLSFNDLIKTTSFFCSSEISLNLCKENLEWTVPVVFL